MAGFACQETTGKAKTNRQVKLRSSQQNPH